MAEQIDGTLFREWLTRLLGTKGVKGQPTKLEMEPVQTVLDVGNIKEYTTEQRAELGTSIFGASSITRQLAARTGAIGFTPLTVDTQLRETYIQAIHLLLIYDTAGAAADSGVNIDLRTAYTDGLGNIATFFHDMRPMWAIIPGRLLYGWTNHGVSSVSFSGNFTQSSPGNIWVPREQGFSIELVRTLGGTWPANTQISIRTNIVQVPPGITSL